MICGVQCVVLCIGVWWWWVMVVKVKVSGHNVEGQGHCDGVEKLECCRVI